MRFSHLTILILVLLFLIITGVVTACKSQHLLTASTCHVYEQHDKQWVPLDTMQQEYNFALFTDKIQVYNEHHNFTMTKVAKLEGLPENMAGKVYEKQDGGLVYFYLTSNKNIRAIENGILRVYPVDSVKRMFELVD